jgi:hypothetical protein
MENGGRGTEKTPIVLGLPLSRKRKSDFMKAQVLSAVNGDAIAEFAKKR